MNIITDALIELHVMEAEESTKAEAEKQSQLSEAKTLEYIKRYKAVLSGLEEKQGQEGQVIVSCLQTINRIGDEELNTTIYSLNKLSQKLSLCTELDDWQAALVVLIRAQQTLEVLENFIKDRLENE